MKRAGWVVSWIALNASLVALVVIGTNGTEWAWNIARFGIAFFTLSTTLCALSKDSRASLRAKGRAVPAFMRGVVDLFVVLWLAGTGHFVFAGLHAWQAAMDSVIWAPDGETGGEKGGGEA